ncbi:hypothetical protein EXIGLDRAFT_706042 [Exidia glandulosa HHB12029]|uniref:Mid2 domain-containing protein n=1 Tax=Exidia glandulosa HHB12029 TaxID=1314781 RepID=A0A165B764_EXIGL|nr:hypothetical protein EXIGLDRAFT_706042 [Exidia glandulosa HHB12029]
MRAFVVLFVVSLVVIPAQAAWTTVPYTSDSWTLNRNVSRKAGASGCSDVDGGLVITLRGRIELDFTGSEIQVFGPEFGYNVSWKVFLDGVLPPFPTPPLNDDPACSLVMHWENLDPTESHTIAIELVDIERPDADIVINYARFNVPDPIIVSQIETAPTTTVSTATRSAPSALPVTTPFASSEEQVHSTATSSSTPTPIPHRGLSLPIIIVIAVCGLLLVIAFLAVLWYLHHRRQRRQRELMGRPRTMPVTPPPEAPPPAPESTVHVSRDLRSEKLNAVFAQTS